MPLDLRRETKLKSSHLVEGVRLAVAFHGPSGVPYTEGKWRLEQDRLGVSRRYL